MTDRTLDLAKALREAQLQRLEASLSARCATPIIKTPQPINEKDVASRDWFGIWQKVWLEMRVIDSLDRTRLSSMSCNECSLQPKSTNKALRNQQEYSWSSQMRFMD